MMPFGALLKGKHYGLDQGKSPQNKDSSTFEKLTKRPDLQSDLQVTSNQNSSYNCLCKGTGIMVKKGKGPVLAVRSYTVLLLDPPLVLTHFRERIIVQYGDLHCYIDFRRPALSCFCLYSILACNA